MFASLFMMLAAYDGVDRRRAADRDLEHSRQEEKDTEEKGYLKTDKREIREEWKIREVVVCPPFPGSRGMMMVTSERGGRRGEEKVDRRGSLVYR